MATGLALLGLAACGEDTVQTPADNGDDSEDTEETPADGVGKLDGGAGGKLDAGKPPSETVPKVDAGPRSTVDAGPKVDASLPVLAKLKPRCVKKPSQVMMIGDSYMNWITHTFGADMAKEAGQSWRMEAIGAYSMGSGGIGFIPDQYKASIMRDPDAHTILMTGGGNDVLVADPALDPMTECKTEKSTSAPQCQVIIDKALAAADKLLQQASKDGIRDVVYFFYPHVPKDTPVGGPNPNPMLDKALPQVRDFCNNVESKTSGKTRCHFLDLVPVFEGHMPDWYQPLDIHENSLGSAAIAKAVWSLMKESCVAQPTGTACCEE